jgi:adenylate kinase
METKTVHKNIILMGPPGSGKGTQAKNIAEHFGYVYFGTGDLMREEAKKDSYFGKIFKAVWDHGQGELVPDDIVKKFVEEKFAKLDFSQGVVFDGFPRTLAQAEHLEQKFTDMNEDFIVFDIEVSDQTLVDRMATRKVCYDCSKIFFKAGESGIIKCDKCGGELYRRQEDEPSVVQKRLDIYEHQTKPLIDFFTKEGRLITIDGEPSIDQVEKDIMAQIHE